MSGMGAPKTLPALLSLLAGLTGCGIAGDLINPELALQLGLDPAYLGTSQGVVLVSFNNTTSFPVVFLAYSTVDAVDPTQGARNFQVPVEAGQVGNEVLDCPVGAISLGSLEAGFTRNTNAVLIQTGTGTETAVQTITWTGDPLSSGESFRCGDVVEFRLSSRTAGEGQAYLITTRVIR